MRRSGGGILIVGSDKVRIHANEVTHNNTLGAAILRNPIVLGDPRQIDPNPNGDEVRLKLVIASLGVVYERRCYALSGGWAGVVRLPRRAA